MVWFVAASYSDGNLVIGLVQKYRITVIDSDKALTRTRLLSGSRE